MSDGDVAWGVERIADWMTATGGLWAPGRRDGGVGRDLIAAGPFA